MFKLSFIMYQGLIRLEWVLSKYSTLEREYDEGDSPFYEAAKRLNKPLSDVTKEDLIPRPIEIWEIPKKLLQETNND